MHHRDVSPHCPTCGTSRTIRVKRKGLLQAILWTRLGYFPWECCGCRKVFLDKNRGKEQRRRRTAKENSETRITL